MKKIFFLFTFAMISRLTLAQVIFNEKGDSISVNAEKGLMLKGADTDKKEFCVTTLTIQRVKDRDSGKILASSIILNNNFIKNKGKKTKVKQKHIDSNVKISTDGDDVSRYLIEDNTPANGDYRRFIDNRNLLIIKDSQDVSGIPQYINRHDGITEIFIDFMHLIGPQTTYVPLFAYNITTYNTCVKLFFDSESKYLYYDDLNKMEFFLAVKLDRKGKNKVNQEIHGTTYILDIGSSKNSKKNELKHIRDVERFITSSNTISEKSKQEILSIFASW